MPEAMEPEQVEPEQAQTEQTEPEQAQAEQSPVFVADEVLLSSVDLARRALLEVTAPETVGSVVGHLVEGEHVLTLLFASDLSGYPGWRWSVTLSRFDETAEPTVLETELMPGETALLAPDWVPWSERLADYRAAQEAVAAAAGDADELDADELDADELDDDDHDDDHDDGDDEFDGIDIDALGSVDETEDSTDDADFDDEESDDDESDDDEPDADESDDDDQSVERSGD